MATLGKGSPEIEIAVCVCFSSIFFVATLGKRESLVLRSLCVCSSIFCRNPCERQLLLLSLLEIFLIFFAWQPLEKGVLKFEIALELFSSIFCWAATLGKGSPEI